jgi:acetoin:2,6-dichlorophenolindophenol oxidoreductase subunit beta
VRMVAPAHTPVPFAPNLEDAYIPDATAIAHAVRHTVAYGAQAAIAR